MMTSQVSYQHLPAECADPPPAYTATEMESRNGNLPTAPLQLEQHPHNLILYNHSSMTSSRVATYSKPRDFFVFTVVLLVLCLLCGNIAIMICVFPALIMSLIANTYNNAEEYKLAKLFGTNACTCNIIGVLFTAVIVMIGSIITIILLFVYGVLNFN